MEEIAGEIRHFQYKRNQRPNDSLPYVIFGRWLYCNSYVDQAIFMWEKVINDLSENPLVHVYLGDAFYSKGLLTKAYDSYQNAINLNEFCTEAHLGLAQLAAETYSYNKANAICDLVASFDNKSINLQICRATILLYEYRFAACLELPEQLDLKCKLDTLCQVISKFDFIVNVRKHFGLDLFREGNIQEAQSLLFTNSILNFKWQIKAINLVHQTGNADLLDFCDLALSLPIMKLDALYNKSQILIQQKKFDLAKKCLENISAISQDFPGVAYFSANILKETSTDLQDKSVLNQLILLYKRELSINPGDLLNQYCLGITYYNCGEHQLSANLLKEIPLTVSIYCIIIQSLMILRLYHEVDPLIKKALKIYPDNLELLVCLAETYRKRTSYLMCLQVLEHAMEQHGRTYDLLNRLGVVLSLDNQLTQAEDIFREAINIEPTNSLSFKNIIAVYGKHENWKHVHVTSVISMKQFPTNYIFYLYEARYMMHIRNWKGAYGLIRTAGKYISKDEANKTINNVRLIDIITDFAIKCEQNIELTNTNQIQAQFDDIFLFMLEF